MPVQDASAEAASCDVVESLVPPAYLREAGVSPAEDAQDSTTQMPVPGGPSRSGSSMICAGSLAGARIFGINRLPLSEGLLRTQLPGMLPAGLAPQADRLPARGSHPSSGPGSPPGTRRPSSAPKPGGGRPVKAEASGCLSWIGVRLCSRTVNGRGLRAAPRLAAPSLGQMIQSSQTTTALPLDTAGVEPSTHLCTAHDSV